MLNWEVENDLPVNQYILEKSYNQQQYIPVYSITSRRSVNREVYTFTDTETRLCHYRLKMIERTGNIYYSGVLFAGKPSVVHIYPVPAGNEVFIQLPVYRATASVTVYAANGRVMKRFTTGSAMNRLDIGHWASGIYAVQVQAAGKVFNYRFIKK